MEVYYPTAPKSQLHYGDQPGLEVKPSEQKSLWQHSSTGSQMKIAGLSVGVFWAVLVALSVILATGIGVGVGVGIGAQKTDCRTAKNSNANVDNATTSTVTTTLFASATSVQTLDPSATTSRSSNPTASAAPYSPCTNNFSSFNNSIVQPTDATGKEIILSNSAQEFRIACDTNYPSGATYGNPNIHDIMRLYMPDFNSCIMACAAYNAGYNTNNKAGVDVGGGLCKVATMVINEGEFCYLKNGTGVNNTSNTSGGTAIRKDSAILV